MANDIDKTSPHYKGEFGSIYEVNQKFPSGGVEGDYVAIDGWAHYWNADRGTWCVNAQRDSYWDELITGIINKLKLFKGATYMGVAGVSTVPEKIAGVKMYYFAKAAGTYSGFGGLQLAQGINVLYTDNGTSWSATPLLEVAQELGVSTEKVMSQNAVNTALDKKADKETVNAALDKKADKETVNAALDKKADKETVNAALDKKADKETVNAALDKKADKATVNASLDLKANKSDVVKTNAAQDAEISRKANQQDVERSLNILRKEIGERTVVEGNVNNNPDEEDLTSKMGSNNREVLSLKDREYNPLEFSGKGYKILRKNLQEVTCAITKIQVTKAPTTDGYVSIIINGVETHVDLVASMDNTAALVAEKIANKLSETMDEYVTSVDGALVTCTRRFGGDVTASSFSGVSTGSEATVSESSKTELRNLITAVMLNQSNCIYEIRYDFDLDGKTLEVPENCTLKFEGGSLGNGTVKGNKTDICASLDMIFRNIRFANKWVITRIYPQWFGALADGNHDDTEAIQEAVDFQSVLANAYTLSNSYTGGSTYTTSIPCVFFTQGTYKVDKINVYSYVYLDGNTALIKSDNANDFVLGSVERKFTNIAGWRCEIRNLIFSCKKAIMLNSRTESSNLDQGFARIEHCQFFGVDEICDVDLQSVLFIVTNCILSKLKKLIVKKCDRFILSNNWIYAATNSIDDYESFFYLFSAQSVIENNLFVPSYQEGKKEIAWFEVRNNRYSIFTGNRFGGEPGSFSLVNCKGENPFKYGYGTDSNLIIQNNQIYTTNGANTSCIIRIFNDFIRNIDVSGNTGCIDTSYMLLPSSTFDYQSKIKELNNNSHLCNLKFNLGANNFDFSRENLISKDEISMIFQSEFGRIVRSKNIEIFTEEKDGKNILVIPAKLLGLTFRFTSVYNVNLKFDCAINKNGFCQHINNFIHIFNYYNEDTDQAQILQIESTNNIFEKLKTNGVSITNVWMKYNDNNGWCKTTHAAAANVQSLTHLGIEFDTDANNIQYFSIEKMKFSSTVTL